MCISTGYIRSMACSPAWPSAAISLLSTRTAAITALARTLRTSTLRPAEKRVATSAQVCSKGVLGQRQGFRAEAGLVRQTLWFHDLLSRHLQRPRDANGGAPRASRHCSDGLGKSGRWMSRSGCSAAPDGNVGRTGPLAERAALALPCLLGFSRGGYRVQDRLFRDKQVAGIRACGHHHRQTAVKFHAQCGVNH
jgi:hypothetical protein